MVRAATTHLEWELSGDTAAGPTFRMLTARGENPMFKPALIFAFVAALAGSLIGCSGTTDSAADNAENADNAE